jgi:cell division protein ZapA
MGQVNVTISGKTYRMACDDGQEDHLGFLGQQLNETIDQLRERFGDIGDQRLTVMAAISMADQHSDSERRLRELEAEIADLRAALDNDASRLGQIDGSVAGGLETLSERLEAIAGRLDGDEDR